MKPLICYLCGAVYGTCPHTSHPKRLTRCQWSWFTRSMVTPFAATLPLGSLHTPSPVAPVRSQAQHDAVAAIVASADFDSACSNPFVPEVGDYTGPFAFLWWDTSGKLHADRIGKTGRILQSATA